MYNRDYYTEYQESLDCERITLLLHRLADRVYARDLAPLIIWEMVTQVTGAHQSQVSVALLRSLCAGLEDALCAWRQSCECTWEPTLHECVKEAPILLAIVMRALAPECVLDDPTGVHPEA